MGDNKQIQYSRSHIKWRAGRLQWGHNLEIITKAAERELEQLKKDHPDWDFNQLARDVKSGKL